MSDSLPIYVNPWLLFRRGETLEGTLSLALMPNLQTAQRRQVGEARVRLMAKKRDDGRTVLRGEARAALVLQCQRCLEDFEETFIAPFEFVIVKSESQLASVSEQDDAIVVEEQLELAPLIEQELILALPMIAKHGDCQANYNNSDSGEAERQQPFANLKSLLH